MGVSPSVFVVLRGTLVVLFSLFLSESDLLYVVPGAVFFVYLLLTSSASGLSSWAGVEKKFFMIGSSAVSVAVSCTVFRVNPQLVQLMRGAPRSHFLLSGELGIGLPCCAAQEDRDPSETPPQHEGWSSTEEENAGV